MVYFDMPHDYGGPKCHDIVKQDQPCTGFWQIIPNTIWHWPLWGISAICTHKGRTIQEWYSNR